MIEPTKDAGSDKDQNQHVFFAYSWDEIRTAPATFVAIFQKLIAHTRLVGFGVCCGSSRRIWGIDPSQNDIEDGIYKIDGTIIPAGSWIARLVFTIHTEMHDGEPTCYPTGIEVFAGVGTVQQLGEPLPDDSQRWFTSSPCSHIVGVFSAMSKQTTPSGATFLGANLGVLECPTPEGVEAPAMNHVMPSVRKYPWKEMSISGVSSLRQEMLLGLNGSPKTYVLCEVSHPEIPILDDVTPFEPISWLLHYDDLESLKRLSFRLDTRDKARLPTVSGIGISFQSGGLGRETRYIGPEELGGFDEDKVEDGISVVHFDIDAHKGERIVSVGVDSADNPRRIMLKRNRGRQLITGSPREKDGTVIEDLPDQDWVAKSVTGDEAIVGIALSVFTTVFENNSNTSKIHSVVVLTQNVPEKVIDIRTRAERLRAKYGRGS